MFNKKIKFCPIDQEMGKVWPHPKPANHFVPEEYKKLERHKRGDLQAPTVKTCMPFLDAMTAGYIIPFDQDYVIDPTEKEFSVTPANREQEDIGYHDKVQVPKK